MTESEWLACARPHILLQELEGRGKLSSRKQQLWICACVKRVGHLLIDDRLRAGVVARDMYADGLVTGQQLRAAEVAAQEAKSALSLPPGFGMGIDGVVPAAAAAYAAFAAAATVEGSGGFRSVPVLILEAVRCEASGKLQVPVTHEWAEAVGADERSAQANLVRDVFCNPFRPVALNPFWLQPHVTRLAEWIYQEEVFDEMPILADALEDAGCAGIDIMEHCRQPGDHVRGCWVVDFILSHCDEGTDAR